MTFSNLRCFNPLKALRRGAFTLAVMAAVLAASCDEESGKCVDSTDCARSMACRQDACIVVDCSNPGDCLDDERCVPPQYGGIDHAGNTCTAACNVFFKCRDNEVCNDGICIARNSPSDVMDVPDEDDDTGDMPDDGRSDATDEGIAADTADAGSHPQFPDCKTCSTNAECGEGYSCLPVGPEKHCLRDCERDADCMAGYTCYQASAEKSCLPVSFACAPCAFDSPCDEGKCCDFGTGQCRICQDECHGCTYDYECRDGMRCFKNTGFAQGICVPGCADVGCADTTNFECADNDRGVPVCKPLGDGCRGCTEPNPYPYDGGCVECTRDLDCDDGDICRMPNHTCVPDTCGDGHVLCESDMECHQCCSDDDCLRFPESTGVCLEDLTCEGAVPCGGLCTDDFPACVVIDGQEQCVQCASDEDCKVINSDCTCNQNYYACTDTDGAICQLADRECGATCEDSSDCPPTTTGAEQQCALIDGGPTGYCYDPAGYCDGSISCCGPGHKCYDIMSILLGSGGMPMPGATAMYCDCEVAEDCISGIDCMDMSILCIAGMGMEMFCPGGQLPAAMPPKMCLNFADLLGGIM
ncbi:MAG TPA: hypothetical protein PLB35_10450 [Myxococcota bacterium]|mgnify:FL=1|nr:hypothetical protein [Myxococcota bacterium]HOH77660.1 hypothetical protein [Myxococcota bacterium]